MEFLLREAAVRGAGEMNALSLLDAHDADDRAHHVLRVALAFPIPAPSLMHRLVAVEVEHNLRPGTRQRELVVQLHLSGRDVDRDSTRREHDV